MISSLTGAIAEIGSGHVEVNVGGVGYLVHVPASTSAALRLGAQVRLLTQMVVREDSMSLFGFADSEQRELFRCLTGITGVGPKLALAVLGTLSPNALRRAVASSDVAALTAVPGVGKRSAERMIVELKSQLGSLEAVAAPVGSKLGEVREALLGLGYGYSELDEVLERLAGADAPVEELVKTALRTLARV